jgi:predicted CoA-substrate-specific enzyme activase
MISAGLDIGSRTVKLAVVDNNRLVHHRVVENSFKPLDITTRLMEGHSYDTIYVTGYGRHLLSRHLNCPEISEIKAMALGAHAFFPGCRTILDIGGQDTKVIALDENGRLHKFEMNDRCAAGTGRFLEIMAMALGYSLEEFSRSANSSRKAEKINNMCAVFAESEVISMVSQGADRAAVAMGIHQAIARRTITMLNRISLKPELVFVGGVANNDCLRKLIEKQLRLQLNVPECPQIAGAYGCALHGQNEAVRTQSR